MSKTAEIHGSGNAHALPTESRHGHRRYLSDDVLEKASSSDESQEDFENAWDHNKFEDGDPFIGISISAEQTRLASPTTPAAEKAAAIGDDPFGEVLPERSIGDDTKTDAYEGGSIDVPRNDESTGAAAVNISQQQAFYNDTSIAVALRHVVGGRPRASTGTLHASSDKNQRKLLPISLPSLPKFPGSARLSMPHMDSALSWFRHSSLNGKTGISEDLRKTTNTDREATSAAVNDIEASPSKRPLPPLRRSTSDGSLFLLRAESHASSLGDDSRWSNIQEQVNSRAKAIRDSLVDSSIKFPRFKTPWHEFSTSARPTGTNTSLASTTDARDFGNPSGLVGNTIRSHAVGLMNGRLLTPGDPVHQSEDVDHPYFSHALKKLTGDVVILGGYRGSILRSADPPHRQLWVPIKVGLGVRKVNLEVDMNSEADVKMPETIFPSGMLKNIGPIDISKRLFKRLKHSENARNGTLRVWDYGYDWRLDPALLSLQLRNFLATLPSNQSNPPDGKKGAFVISHSLGGLIVRHAVNTALKSNQDLIAGIIYAGVPQTCVNILGPLRNGDDVLLSSKVLTAQVNFSIRTSFALLPLDGVCFVDKNTQEEYRIDFFDPKTWEEYRLSPCCRRPLPPNGNAESVGMIDSLMNSVASILPSTTMRKATGTETELNHKESTVEATPQMSPTQPLAPQTQQSRDSTAHAQNRDISVATHVTISREDAMEYLTRTLRDVKKFKEDLAFDQNLTNKYPPAAVIYGKSIPTVIGARVEGREGIKRSDAYDDLAFASGDGVVLARAAQIPDGYRVARGGVVSSDRGHISLLGDLEAVGQCINAILAEQRRRRKFQSMASWKQEYEED